MSLVILIVLVLGVGAGYLMPADVSGFLDSASTYMLLLLLFSVGIDTGLNKAVFTRIRELGFRILLIPFGVALGSLCGGVVTAFLLSLPAKEGLAISAGLGWYSLSGVLITEAGNPVGGTIAFLANVFREMLTFVIVPFVASLELLFQPLRRQGLPLWIPPWALSARTRMVRLLCLPL